MDPLQDAIKFLDQVTRQINQVFQPKPENSYRQSLRESTEPQRSPLGQIHSPGIRGERHTWLLPPAEKRKVPSRTLGK